MTTGNNDLDALDAEPTPLKLASGTHIKVERLKTRAMMSLLKILTRGASEVLSQIQFGEETSQEDFTGQLIGATLLAIPEAEDETIEFVQRMVSPAGLKEGRSKAALEFNLNLEQQLREELNDPELEDLFVIVQAIITNEAPHVRALGNQFGVLFKASRMNAAAKQSASSENASKA